MLVSYYKQPNINLLIMMYPSLPGHSNLQLSLACKPSYKYLSVFSLTPIKQLHSEILICILHHHYMEFTFLRKVSSISLLDIQIQISNLIMFPSFSSLACGNNLQLVVNIKLQVFLILFW